MYVTTRWYRAPELLCFSSSYGSAVDMWSAGCIIAELFTRKPLFQGTDPLSQLEQVVRFVGHPSEEDLEAVMNEGALQFIEALPRSEVGALALPREASQPPLCAPAPLPALTGIV